MQIDAGAPLCVTARSARANTFELVGAELLPATASAVADDTVTVLPMEPASGGAATTTEIDGAAAIASDGRVHVTGPVPEHAHPVPVAETNEEPAGRGTPTESELACDGPALATLIV